MKNYRVDFHKGVNIVGDKAVIPDGFVTFADGVDLRSGLPRPFFMPQFKQEATAGSNCLFEFRGQWFYSTDYREYAAEYINGHNMVYWSGEGIQPQKWVDGDQADLGCILPESSPVVATTSTLRTTLSAAQLVGQGNYNGGEAVSYRVAPRTKNGVMPPSNRAQWTVPSTVSGVAIKIEWTSNVEGVLGWQVFIGPSGSEQFYLELGPLATSYTDRGVYVGNGPLATSYQATNPYTYIYTFERTVGGVTDEGGPSYPSNAVSSEAGRRVSIDTMNDGYWQQDGVQTVSLTYVTSDSTYPATTFTQGNWNSVSNLWKITSYSPHGLETGDTVYFGGGSSPDYPNGELDVTIDISDVYVFYVSREVSKSGSGPTWWRPAKTIIHDSTAAITDGDYIKTTGLSSSVETVFGVYRAHTYDATAGYYELDLYTDDATWGGGGTKSITGGAFLPNNNYYTYRNLYRTGDSDSYQLVTKLKLDETYYDDATSAQFLGGQPDSYYQEIGSDGIPSIISFEPAPVGLRSIVTHYGMEFGILGNTVRWTPTGRPDAWPVLYSISFAQTPVRLVPYSQSLIVLCEDAIYRIDGNRPNQLSCMVTQAMDGCVAPNSVQIINNQVVYLARRGIMSFDGHKSMCLTDSRIPSAFWEGTSWDDFEPFWIKPSLATYNYANLAMGDGIQGANDSSYTLNGTLALPGPNYAIRSFQHFGKYFLYWALPYNNYLSHSCVCIDLQAADMPVTTMPIKPNDVHVAADGQSYMLIRNDEASAKVIREAINAMSDAATYTLSGDVAVFKFNSDRTIKVPYHIRTGAISLGAPLTKKRFSAVRVHGSDPEGTYRIRIFIDDRYVADGRVVPTSNPNKIRQANIPIKSCIGYTIDVELSGDAYPRALEFLYDPIANEVDSGNR